MINFGISSNICIPIRKGPDQRSEMTSQLLYGEIFKVIQTIGGWHKIQLETDGYLGWIMDATFQAISEEDYNKYLSSDKYILRSLTKAVCEDSSNHLFLPPGSVILNQNIENRKIKVGLNNYILDNVIIEKPSAGREAILKTAHYFLDAPYIWGGRSLLGIDCSGLSQLSYLINGIRIKRDASQQAEEGTQVFFLNESKPGDLAFFDDDKGAITHVGILLGEDKIIHASGRVRIDKIDYQGIIRYETNEYSHKLRLIKSIL